MRPSVRALAVTTLLGTLALTGCTGQDGDATGTGATTGTSRTTATDGTAEADDGAATGGTSRDRVDPPTEPADIPVEPGERSAGGGTDVVVEGDRAAFVTPGGDVACTVNGVTAVCEVADPAFTPQPDHMLTDGLGDCPAEEADAIMIAERGAWTCVEDDLRAAAGVGAGGWWADDNGSETEEVDGEPVAVLPYGSTITVGQVSCSSAEDGVRCTSAETGRSFFVSPGRYNYG